MANTKVLVIERPFEKCIASWRFIFFKKLPWAPVHHKGASPENSTSKKEYFIQSM